jgi:hypothetical protein
MEIYKNIEDTKYWKNKYNPQKIEDLDINPDVVHKIKKWLNDFDKNKKKYFEKINNKLNLKNNLKDNLNDVSDLKDDLELEDELIIGDKNITFLPTMKQLITKFLEDDKDVKIKQCLEIFAENVLNEMMLDSYKYANRQNFSLFFRTYISDIREELFEEFKEVLTPTEFDLCIRKAISTYEGINYLI